MDCIFLNVPHHPLNPQKLKSVPSFVQSSFAPRKMSNLPTTPTLQPDPPFCAVDIPDFDSGYEEKVKHNRPMAIDVAIDPKRLL